MDKGLKSILKNPTPPEWEEADEIVPHIWLGTMKDNEHARRRNISEVICISKDPLADLQREGFREAPYLDKVIFTLDSDDRGDLLWIFGEICDAIDGTLGDEEGVLVWDIGGGVAAMAAYSKYNELTRSAWQTVDESFTPVMRSYHASVPEAMMVITRARLKQERLRVLPRDRIIDSLHNDTYLRQLDMWGACDYDVYENVVTNPSEPVEKWIVERVKGDSGVEKRRGVIPTFERTAKRLSQICEQPHRLSTIAEVEEEARRFSWLPHDWSFYPVEPEQYKDGDENMAFRTTRLGATGSMKVTTQMVSAGAPGKELCMGASITT